MVFDLRFSQLSLALKHDAKRPVKRGNLGSS